MLAAKVILFLRFVQQFLQIYFLADRALAPFYLFIFDQFYPCSKEQSLGGLDFSYNCRTVEV
jgi:hypothetical protein